MPRDYGRSYEFGPFLLDAGERQLFRNGQLVPLTPKAFETLLFMVEHRGRLIEKEELMRALWPNSFVEEANLTNNVWTLRNALGESRDTRKYIETAPKRGYRFVADVRIVNREEETELIAEKHTVTRIITEEEQEDRTHTGAQNADGYAPSHINAQRERAPRITEADALPMLSGARGSKTRIRVLVAFGLVLVLAALAARELLKSGASATDARRVFQTMQVSRFTASGNIVTAAISPDGKYVATVLDEGGFQSLWIRQVAANTSGVRLIAPALVDYWGLTFSNDANFIYYVSWVRNASAAELYQLPVLGGTPRKLPTPLDTPISFSPTGDRFSYVVSSSSKGESYVKVASVDGDETQTVVTRRDPEFFTAYPGGAAWSPDGRFIAFAAGGPIERGSRRVSVFVADVEDKHERRLTEQSWHFVGRVAWLGDGSGIVISARDQMDEPRQLWFVSYPDGAARKITNDLHDYDSVSLSSNGKTLAAVQTQEAFSISIAGYRESSGFSSGSSSTSEIFSEVGSGRERVSWTPDGRIVYC